MICGCGQKAKPWAKVGYAGGLHGYKLEVEGPGAHIETNGRDDPILMVGEKEIVVQKEQIVVDGMTKAKMPSGTKAIRAISRNGEVVVEVDGQEVFQLGP
jgi:hypothetical protein